MLKTVFILGAGASKLAGAPLMNEFLDRADELRRVRADVVRNSLKEFDDVFAAIAELQGVFAKSHLDLDNIESLFGAIEMGLLLNKMADRDESSIQGLRDAIVTVIYKTLEAGVEFPVSEGKISPPKPYRAFVDRLFPRNDPERTPLQVARNLSFITFNYDLALDYALHFRGIPYSYGLENGNHDGTLLLKLHGSTNWGVCTKCNNIVPYPIKEARFDLSPDSTFVVFDLGSKLSHRSHCDTELSPPPLIVPPTWNKTGHHEQLAKIWRRAAAVLGAAENLFVIGYSLPETDSFFRYLFALGTESATRVQRLWIINPDDDGSVETRFRHLIGRGIERRVQFRKVGFEQAIREITEAALAR